MKIKKIEKEFDKQFAIGQGRRWLMTPGEANEVKSFIRQAIKQVVESVPYYTREQLSGDEDFVNGVSFVYEEIKQWKKKILKEIEEER